jgi:hypothetical protein
MQRPATSKHHLEKSPNKTRLRTQQSNFPRSCMLLFRLSPTVLAQHGSHTPRQHSLRSQHPHSLHGNTQAAQTPLAIRKHGSARFASPALPSARRAVPGCGQLGLSLPPSSGCFRALKKLNSVSRAREALCRSFTRRSAPLLPASAPQGLAQMRDVSLIPPALPFVVCTWHQVHTFCM